MGERSAKCLKAVGSFEKKESEKREPEACGDGYRQHG
jgi:hypothetical protein